MYEGFYGLSADPFRLSADHRFCFSHRSYARAKAYVQYALYRAEGFVMVTGRPGTGKTTLVNDLLSTLPNKEVVAGTLVSTQLEAEDLLLMTAHSFGLEVQSTQKAMVLQRLMDFMNQQHRQGLRTLLIIDEAQDLAASALEELRLLTNLQRNGEPLLQIALLGQDSLRKIIRVPAMEQVHQRLIAAWRLEPLTLSETIGYVQHRLERAGWTGDPSFESGVLSIVQEFSKGIPRRINLICSRLLLHGFIGDRHTLTTEDAATVSRELHREELALPDYQPEGGGEGDFPRPGRSPVQGDDEHVWAEIDRGILEPRSKGAKPHSPVTETRAPGANRDAQPEMTHSLGIEPDEGFSIKPAEESGRATFSTTTHAAAHVIPEQDDYWRRVREEPDRGPFGGAADGQRSRLRPWIVFLVLVWLGLAGALLFSRGLLDQSPATVRDGSDHQLTTAIHQDDATQNERSEPGDQEDPGAETQRSLSPPETLGSLAEVIPTPVRIFFDVNSSRVDPQFRPQLDEVARWLVQYEESYAEIVGYTDPFGPRDYNLALSGQRARAVANQLLGLGVSTDRLRVDGQGVHEPDSGLALSREEQRMVEITVGHGVTD